MQEYKIVGLTPKFDFVSPSNGLHPILLSLKLRFLYT
jgi:hypothetical protein